MTPKEKAKELLDNQKRYVQKNVDGFRGNPKLLALGTAHEVLEALKKIDMKFNLGLEGTLKFWSDVKSEIELL